MVVKLEIVRIQNKQMLDNKTFYSLPFRKPASPYAPMPVFPRAFAKAVHPHTVFELWQ